MIHIQCIIPFNMRHMIKQIIILLINYGFCFLYIIITLINILLIHVMYISNIIVQFDDLSHFPKKKISFHCQFAKSQINLSLFTSFRCPFFFASLLRDVNHMISARVTRWPAVTSVFGSQPKLYLLRHIPS